MTSRLDPRAVWLAHWRGLQNRRTDEHGKLQVSPDRTARTATLVVPPLGFAAALVPLVLLTCPGWKIDTDLAGAGIAAAGLLFGSLLSAFALIATWRDRVTERDRDRERPLGWMIDEAVGHLVLAVMETPLLVIANIVSVSWPGTPSKIGTAASVAILAHIILLFAMSVPRLYSAYTQVNPVPEELNGFSKLR